MTAQGFTKAAVSKSTHDPLEIRELQIPKVGPNDCLVKMEACGVCHTDLHVIEGDWTASDPNFKPFIAGHEGVGIVVDKGEMVDSVEIGERVGIPWLYSACGHCEYCLSGWEPLCKSQKNPGLHVDGAFSEYAIAAPDWVAHLPKDIDVFEVAPVLCAGLTVYKGLKMTDCKAGDIVVIGGCGGLGQMAIQYGKSMGFDVIGVDIDDQKVETAKKLGAIDAVNALKTDPVQYVQEKYGGAHGALITAVSRPAFAQAMGYLRRGGTMALNGLPPGEFPIDIIKTVLNGITIRGSIVGSRMDMIEALRFFEEGKIHTIYKKDKLENINQIFDDLKNGKVEGRVILDFKQ